MANYLVTGAAGFVGSHLCERLVAEGHFVHGLDSFTPYYARELKVANLARLSNEPSFRFTEADITGPGVLALAGSFDGVFHLAAQAGVRASWGQSFEVYLRDNLLATQMLFEYGVARGVRVVFVSSSSVYGNAETYPTSEHTLPEPVSPYGITKLTCEHLARAYAISGLDAVSLRYFTVYGPRQRPDMAFTRIARALILNEEFEVYGTGAQSRDVTYVDDAVAATVAAMERGRPGATYNIGGGSETSLNQAIELFEQASGRSLRVMRTDFAKGDVQRTVSDCGAIAADTGWAPRTEIAEGIRRQLAWAEGVFGRNV